MIKKMKLIVTMMLIMWVTTVVIMIWELSVTQFEANPSAIKLLEIDFLKIPIPPGKICDQMPHLTFVISKIISNLTFNLLTKL